MTMANHPSSTTKNASRSHLYRRFQHALTGILLLAISYIVPAYPVGFVLLVVATWAFYCVHRMRVHDPAWDRWYLESFDDLLRDYERGEWECEKKYVDGGTSDSNNQFCKLQNDHSSTYKRKRKINPALPGAFYFLLGTSFSTFCFPTAVARASLLVLSIADPLAGLVGAWFSDAGWNITWKQLLQRYVGKGKNSGREEGGPSMAGSTVCAISTVLCTHVYFKIMPKQKSTGQNRIRPVEYPSFEVSDPSEVPRINGKLIF